MSWRDLVITPVVSGSILVSAALASTYLLRMVFGPDVEVFAWAMTFLLFQTLLTIFTIRIVLWLRCPREGLFSTESHPIDCYFYNLVGFLCNTHLWFEFSVGVIPPVLRKSFYRLLGGRFGKGIISIGGVVSEPWLVSIEEEAILGMESLVLPHAILTRELMLGRIEIGKGAVVGAKSILMPGVRVGEGAMVNAMSVVSPNTQIGSYEVWGGNPARKVGQLSRPEVPGNASWSDSPTCSKERAAQIRAMLVDFVVRHSVATPSDLGPSTRLFSSGLLGSMDLVQLVLFVEAEVGVRLGDCTELRPERMDDLDELVEMIMSHLSPMDGREGRESDGRH